MKITPLVLAPQLPLDGITSGIFPYLGGSVSADQLRSVVMAYESAVVPGRQGAKLAANVPGVLIDPAVYAPQARTEPETLFDYDDWLMRQQAAGVPLILTDSPRIRKRTIRRSGKRWRGGKRSTNPPWWSCLLSLGGSGKGFPVSSRRSGRPDGRWRSSCWTGTTPSTSRER